MKIEEMIWNISGWWEPYLKEKTEEQQADFQRLLVHAVGKSLERYQCCVLSSTYQPEFLLESLCQAAEIPTIENPFPTQTTMLIMMEGFYIKDLEADPSDNEIAEQKINFPLRYNQEGCDDLVNECVKEILKI